VLALPAAARRAHSGNRTRSLYAFTRFSSSFSLFFPSGAQRQRPVDAEVKSERVLSLFSRRSSFPFPFFLSSDAPSSRSSEQVMGVQRGVETHRSLSFRSLLPFPFFPFFL